MTLPSAPSTPNLPRPAARVGWVDLLALAVAGGLLGGTALGRVVRGPDPALAVVVTFLPYLYVAVATCQFALWTLFPDRRGPPVGLAAVGLLAAVMWGPAWSARPESADGAALRVVSWNVQRLWGSDTASDCVISTLEGLDPDVVALLEVSARDVEHLSGALGLRCVHVDYLGTGSEVAGGLASCVRGDGLAITGAPQRFSDDDPWSYVFSEIDASGRRFNLLTVHLHPYWPLTGADLRDGVERLAQGEPGPLLDAGQHGSDVLRAQGAQAVALLDRVERFQDPTLVAGDFNSTRDGALHVGLRGRLVDTFERGGQGFGATVRALGVVPLRIDYVYATPDFAVRGAHTLAPGCSDHDPVVSDLVLRDTP
jgi:endonuclease/exonuclease/phosphatase (EEP) superfamily protein YafD